jgi:hypothetical protein
VTNISFTELNRICGIVAGSLPCQTPQSPPGLGCRGWVPLAPILPFLNFLTPTGVNPIAREGQRNDLPLLCVRGYTLAQSQEWTPHVNLSRAYSECARGSILHTP